MKKIYAKPLCEAAIMETCQPLATSAKKTVVTDNETTVDEKEIKQTDEEYWIGAKKHTFSIWEDE